jgi:hypothetical protein
MTPALLVTTFPGKHVEQSIVPKLRAANIDVRAIVTPGSTRALDDVKAVLVIAQGTSEADRMALRKRAHAAQVSVVVLPPEASRWPGILSAAHLPDEPEPVMKPAPAPVAPPPKPAPAPVAPPPKPADPPRPTAITFGAWLKSCREQSKATSVTVAATLGVSDSLLYGWESERMPIARDHLAKVYDLYGKPPAHVAAPQLTQRQQRRDQMPEPVAIQVPPVATPPKVNGHAVNGKAHHPPLLGLLRAARALKIAGPVTITINDAQTTIEIGEECFPGALPDEAVAAAREHLNGKLAEQVRAAQAALAELGAS